ncbi:MAG: hypothetical protein J6J00_07100 [Treponema sp.]|nr:hypothetical protein [Treponema sp.]
MNANLTSEIAKTSQISTVKAIPKFLKNGDSALVRVIADKGNGRYEGFVSGVKVSFSSAHPLRPGSSFLAKVQLNQNTIVLIPKNNTEIQQKEGVTTLKLSQVAGLLQELGLVPDNISLALVQSAKQMEMKIDSSLLSKIRNMLVRMGNKSRFAGELALLLAEKGINANESELLELIDLLNSREESDDNTNEGGIELLNKANSVKGSWYLFPFEMTLQEKLVGNGTFRLLIGKDDRLKLLNVFCFYGGVDYYFSLEHSDGKCKKIRFNIQKDGFELKEFENQFKNHLDKSKLGFEIEWAEKESVEGSASASEELYSFGGQV